MHTMQRTIVQLPSCRCRLRVFRADFHRNSLRKYESTSIELSHHRINLHDSATSYAQNVEGKEKKPVHGKEVAKHVSQWWFGYLKSLSFKERCVNRISKCLGCSEYEAKTLISLDESTFLDRIDATLEKMEFLLVCDVTLHSIQTNFTALRLSLDELKVRMDHIEKWQIQKSYHSSFLPMFRLPISDFLVVSNQFMKEKDEILPYGNRVIYFAKELETSVIYLNRRFVKCKSLYVHDFEQMRLAMECYRKYGIKNEFILKEIRGLKCDVYFIEKRLSRPYEEGLYPLTPGFVFRSSPWYNRRVEELEKQKNYYRPHRNRDEYLSANLFLNKNHIPPTKKAMIISFFESFDAKRLTSVMEFLVEKEFTPDQIFTNRNAFYHDADTLKKRYETLQKVGIQNPTLKSLLKNGDRFEEFVERAKFNRKERKEIISETSHLISSSRLTQ